MEEDSDIDMQGLRDENETLRREIERRDRELAELRRENADLAQQYIAVERRSTDLAHLYVATYRLHETLDRPSVLLAIEEILANLIGSEEYAVFEVCAEGGALGLIASCGIDPDGMERIDFGQGIIGHVASTGQPFVESPADHGSASSMTACIPLETHGGLIGVIAIFGLLQQKARLEPLDHEILDLLAKHAAVALFATRSSGVSSNQPERRGKEYQ